VFAKCICSRARQFGNSELAAALDLQRPFKILKRAKDETPLKLRSAAGELETVMVLNSQVDFRWGCGAHQAATVPQMPAEMLCADTNGFADALNRTMPCFSLPNLASGIEKSGVFAFFEICDSGKVNIRHCKIQSALFPRALHWCQRCESHTSNLVTMRAYEARNIIAPLYCWTKLLRLKA
jgi:hypothetical protein